MPVTDDDHVKSTVLGVEDMCKVCLGDEELGKVGWHGEEDWICPCEEEGDERKTCHEGSEEASEDRRNEEVPTTPAADSSNSSDASTEASFVKQPWRYCAVVGCTKPTQPMHRMPQKDELRRKWLKLIGLPKSETRIFLFVCQRHFAPDAYTRNPDLQKDMGFTARYYLRSDAMPSLSLPSESNLEEVEEETSPKQTASACERVAEAQRRAPLRQYGRRHPRGTVTTQTGLLSMYSWCAGLHIGHGKQCWCAGVQLQPLGGNTDQGPACSYVHGGECRFFVGSDV
ncbi:hypothetical protein MTO96_002364 [Rhipicephalus appendiculatus]